MAKDVSDTVRDALGHVVSEALKSVGEVTPHRQKSSPLSGAKGVAAGAGLAALAPLAKKGVDAVRANGLSGLTPSATKLATRVAGKTVSKAGDRVTSSLKDVVGEQVEQAGGAGGLVKEAASGLLPGTGGGGDGAKGGAPGVGKGRRMPVQQAVDVAVPIETAYNQYTQFEEWPQFMHRVTRVTQEDDCTVSFATKIWGKTKEFTAQIETQRPDERIKWRVSQGITHTGVVTFHELAPRLTRIEVNVDVDPGSLIEKAARGMRHVKRAVRADLHRYKAFIEMQELETGAWRGVIEDGELVEGHDESYDEERDYLDSAATATGDEPDEPSGEQDEQPEQPEPSAERDEDEDEQPEQPEPSAEPAEDEDEDQQPEPSAERAEDEDEQPEPSAERAEDEDEDQQPEPSAERAEDEDAEQPEPSAEGAEDEDEDQQPEPSAERAEDEDEDQQPEPEPSAEGAPETGQKEEEQGHGGQQKRRSRFQPQAGSSGGSRAAAGSSRRRPARSGAPGRS